MKREPFTKTRLRVALFRNQCGTAVIELAIALPVLLMLVFGIISFGSWIALSHSVQQAANEGSRAAIAGLTIAERATLARATVTETLRQNLEINPAKVTVTVQDDGSTMTVGVVYDAASNPLLLLPIIPAPATRIERKSIMKLTGL